jgi:hypothetical protein
VIRVVCIDRFRCFLDEKEGGREGYRIGYLHQLSLLLTVYRVLCLALIFSRQKYQCLISRIQGLASERMLVMAKC